MNEIHGAWFDPSNPVVQFSGKLRSDLFKEMLEWENKADLCITLGTSLSGMNADRCANTPAKKSLKGEALGTVLINIQKTNLDAKCVIRIWAKIDDAFKILAKELDLEIKEQKVPTFDSHKFIVPYDEKGKYNKKYQMILDLNVGSEITIPIEGAMNENAKGEVVEYDEKSGIYVVAVQEKFFDTSKAYHRCFGYWWITEALEGKITQLPVINLNPVVTKKSKKIKKRIYV